MKKNTEMSAIIKLLMQSDRFLVLAHYNPDADAYGSSCSLSLGLQNLGKQVTCVNESGIIDRYLFIPGVSAITNELPDLSSVDLVIACDCGDFGRIGDSFKPALKGAAILNIDHHKSNTYFGAYNWVVPEASSTSELVFELLEELGLAASRKLIDKTVASGLFAGLSADTGSFRYSSTTPKTLQTAQHLISYGASSHEVAQSLFGNESLAAVKLQAEALMSLEVSAGGRIARVTVPAELLKKYQATADDTEALVERARDIRGVEVAVLLRQDPDFWKVSLRSKNDRLDVSQVAAAFGGGGHKAAAGFRSKKSLAELEASLLPKLEALLNA